MRHNPFAAPATLRAHQVRTLEDRVNVIRGLVWGNGPEGPAGSLRDPIMRQIGLAVTHTCPPRNDLCELKAIFDFIVKNVRYTGDIAGKDTFQKALRTLQYGGGDCLPIDTRVEHSNGLRVPIFMLEEGDYIRDGVGWTEVRARWLTGTKPILRVAMDDGSELRCAPQHRLVQPGRNRALPRRVRAEKLRADAALMSARAAKRIVSVVEEPGVLCADLTTSTGSFWLPDADVQSSNCDDHFILGSTLAAENGFYSKARITSNTGATWDHIYLMAGVPKHNPRRWVALDTTLGAGKFGVEPGRAKFKDFTVVGMEE